MAAEVDGGLSHWADGPRFVVFAGELPPDRLPLAWTTTGAFRKCFPLITTWTGHCTAGRNDPN